MDYNREKRVDNTQTPGPEPGRKQVVWMNEKLQRFYKQIQGKEVSFLGLGRSHRELLGQFAQAGARVTLRDKRTREQLGREAAQLEEQGVRLLLGEGYLEGLEQADLILRTPGFYYNRPELTAAREAGAWVTSEMELFFDLCPCPIYAVTGSDGKTTTTTIIARFWEAQGKKVFLGGNIGVPLLPRIGQMGPEDVAVAELSSFQLISMRRSPDVAVVTNVAPNHLDVHGTMEEYIDSKKNIFLHQSGCSRTVLNQDNDITAGFLPLVRGEAVTFSRKGSVRRGAWLREDGMICVRDRKGETELLHKDQIRIPGIHNVENYLAAISAVWGQVSPEVIVRVARSFGGVEHRIEFVRELDGVKWYNDSIATSPTRTMAGLDSFPGNLVLLAGGYDKKIPFEPMVPKILEKVRVLILCGATADKIRQAVTSHPDYDPARLPILEAKTLDEAVQIARREARPGDIVSLSPACAAFDQFVDFEARGRYFKQLVQSM